MIRTQIQLTEEQARALKARARLEERSMAELVRECVAEYLARRPVPNVRELARRARGPQGTLSIGMSRSRRGARPLPRRRVRRVSLFVDTSALLAFLDADQPRHADVIDAWERAIAGDRHLFTSNYVLVESFALVQRRLGLDALRALADILVPLLRPLWIDEDLHAAAVAALFAASRRKLSLVDCTSFELMRRHGLTEATGAR